MLDRLLQQALLQVLTPVFDPHFSDRSHGFRPGRSAHGALSQAKEAVASGKRWVVDLDLEKFFDRVTSIEEGTPQGGPLSPLLSNILLDAFDKELERRGLAFVRYADDCNVYVASRRAGERVMASLTRFLTEALKLTVNAGKSAVARPWTRKFLGYTMTHHHKPKLSVAPESARRLRAVLTTEFRRARGQSLRRFVPRLALVLRGWAAYFSHSEVKARFEEIDEWVRHKLRRVVWKQWKTPRTRYDKLRQRGLNEAHARQCVGNGRGPWWNARQAHMHLAVPTKELKSLGLESTLEVVQTLQEKRTAGYGTVRPVV